MLSRSLDPGRGEEETPGLPVPLEAPMCVCWVSAAEEVPFVVEGYGDDVDGSRVKRRHGGFWRWCMIGVIVKLTYQ
jgi:hypothetical protein